MKLENKHAVVTGGQSGLGQAVTMALLSNNIRVSVFDIVEHAHADFGAFKTSQLAQYCVDVESESSVEQALATAIQTFGDIHICINCAGILRASKTLDRDGQAAPLDQFQKMVQVNLIGTFNVCRLAAACMAKNASQGDEEKGVIINTSSIAAYEGQKGQCAYSASKGAIASMTLPMARDLSHHGIRVMSIAPGTMATPMMNALPDNIKSDLSAKIPFPKRMGYPSEFAQLTLSIIENSYLNGETIRLDGGLRMN